MEEIMVSANYGYYNPYNPYLQQNAYGNTLANQSYVQTPVFYGNAQMNAVYEPPVPEKPTKDGKDEFKVIDHRMNELKLEILRLQQILVSL